jgi:cell division protein FtsB
MLVNILIIFFIILIFYQVFLSKISVLSYRMSNGIIEGMDTSTSTSQQYQPYDKNNAMILAQQNAGNIEVLKQQLDKISGLNQEVQDISGNLAALTTQVSNLMVAQQQYVQTNLPSSPPQITGTD